MAKRDSLAKQLQPFDSMMQAVAEAQVNGRAVKKRLVEILRPVKQRVEQLIPPPGYPGDDPELKPLRKTVTIRTRDLDVGTWFGIVGPTWPSGAHAHLVEEGTEAHDIPNAFGRGPDYIAKHPGSKATHYMREAWESVEPQVMGELTELMGEEFVKAIRTRIASKPKD